MKTQVKSFVAFSFSLLLFSVSLRAQMTDVLTYHNDNARTGQALHEEILTPAILNDFSAFGFLWTNQTDGAVDALP